jgi:hypothetical protein
VIAPHALMVDFEPDGFALINRLVSARVHASPPTLSLLHDAGVPVRAVHSSGGAVPALASTRFDDAGAHAERLLDASGADRVVLYDRSRTDALATAMARNAPPEATQLEAFWRNDESFWACEAIATAPAPPQNPWPAVQRRLAAIGADWWALLALYEGESCAATLLAQWQDGAVQLFTSLDHIVRNERPPRERASDLVAMAERAGPVRLALICDVSAFAAAMTQPDLAGGIAALRHDPETLFHRNLDVLEEHP